MEYPKILTLYERDENFRVDTSKLIKPHFDNIKRWYITEKIDGTNIRVGLHPDGIIEFGGRGEESQMPVPLYNFLTTRITPGIVQAAFKKEKDTNLWPEVAIFGEGYGPGIGKGGKYREDISFIIFDVIVDGWWLSRANVMDVARKLGFPNTVPDLRIITGLPKTEEDLRDIIGCDGESMLGRSLGKSCLAEGIVARADPHLFFNNGNPIMWKLKFRDFRGKGKKDPAKEEITGDGNEKT